MSWPRRKPDGAASRGQHVLGGEGLPASKPNSPAQRRLRINATTMVRTPPPARRAISG